MLQGDTQKELSFNWIHLTHAELCKRNTHGRDVKD